MTASFIVKVIVMNWNYNIFKTPRSYGYIAPDNSRPKAGRFQVGGDSRKYKSQLRLWIKIL